MSETSRKEINLSYFAEQLPALLAQPLYVDKYVVICEESVRGVFDTFDAALTFAVGNCPADEFVVQQVADESKKLNFIKSAT